MKQLIAWPLCWLLYWLGHWTSLPMHQWDWAFLYRPYNRLMLWSWAVQDWGGARGPWERRE